MSTDNKEKEINSLGSFLDDLAGEEAQEAENTTTEIENEEEVEFENEEEQEQELEQEEEQVENTEGEEKEELNEQEELFELEEEEIVEETDSVNLQYEEIGKALGVEVKTKEELVDKFKQLQEENSSLKEKTENNPYSNLPDKLKEAIELANNGGDYLSYLEISSFDYDSIPDREFLAYQMRPYFPEGEDGQIELEDYLDSIGDYEIRIKSRQAKEALKKQDDARINEIKTKAQQTKQQIISEAEKAVERMQAVQGFKVTDSQKRAMKNAIKDGKTMFELFYNEQGQYDFDKMVDVYYKYTNFDKIVDFLKQRSKNETKKEMVERLTNSNVGRKGTPVKPSGEKESALDLFYRQITGQ